LLPRAAGLKMTQVRIARMIRGAQAISRGESEGGVS
jgi:hypothetical protein